jgi:hypothetical protein
MPAPTGAHTTLWYLWEEDGSGSLDFAVGAGTSDGDRKPFGGDATLNQFEGGNNAVDIFEPNSRRMAQLVAQHFDGSFTVDFEWTNSWWLKGLISDPSTVDNGDGTYTHTFDGDTPFPFVICAGYDDRATDVSGQQDERYLEGCVVQSATVDVSTEGTADVSLTGAYVNEDYQEDVALAAQPSLNEDVMTFADAILHLDGSVLSLVQDASVEVNNNTDIIRELGTRVGVDYSPKALIPSVDYTKIHENETEIEDMYGETAATSVQQNVDTDKDMKFEVDNGEAAGSGLNQAQFDMGGSLPDTVGTENVGNPQEDLQESINRRLQDISAKATNEVATAR